MAAQITKVLVAGVVAMCSMSTSANANPRFPSNSTFQSRCELRADRRVALSGALVAKIKALQAKLQITPEQRAQVRAVLSQFGPQLKQEVISVGEARLGLGRAIRQTSLNTGEIEAAASALGEAIRSLALTRGSLYSELAKVLTSEQLGILSSEIDSIQSTVDQALSSILLKMAA